ncbi:MAG: phospholipase D-like domain-containing protein [Rhodocyclaceae bacterium]|nr:phospholipase D-like domain-containing protein [Rhodocyclaceae bacterium]
MNCWQRRRAACALPFCCRGRVEYALQHYATRALYGVLLEGGIRIFKYHQGFHHAKVAVVDGCWATMGSSNIDPFSLLLARGGQPSLSATSASPPNCAPASMQRCRPTRTNCGARTGNASPGCTA